MSGGHFSIVGIFSSPELAQTAAEILGDMLKAIAQWHRDHPEESKKIFDEWTGLEPIITPIEEKLKLDYGVEWDLPVLIRDEFELSTYNHFLFLRNTWSTRTVAYPLDRFIERLGGTALVQGSYIYLQVDGELKITIQCTAPNEQVVQEVVTGFGGNVVFGKTITIDVEEIHDGQSVKHFGQRIPEIMDYIKKAGCYDIHVTSNQLRNYYIDWDK